MFEKITDEGLVNEADGSMDIITSERYVEDVTDTWIWNAFELGLPISEEDWEKEGLPCINTVKPKGLPFSVEVEGYHYFRTRIKKRSKGYANGELILLYWWKPAKESNPDMVVYSTVLFGDFPKFVDTEYIYEEESYLPDFIVDELGG